MCSIELITKRFLLNSENINSRYFTIPKKQAILVFADTVDNILIDILKSFLAQNLTVVLITLVETNFRDKNLFTITVSPVWYIHTIFKDPLYFHFVYANGLRAKKLAEAFSQFTLYKIEIIKNIEHLKDIITKQENNVLIQNFDGVGDILMMLPALKKLYQQGFKIDVAGVPERKGIFDNLKYINSFSSKRKGINLSYYKRFQDISGKYCDYSSLKNHKHRIDIISDLLDVSPVPHDIDIILTEQEIQQAREVTKNLHRKKLLICFESAEQIRSYSYESALELIPQIKNFDLIFVGKARKDYPDLNLTGKTKSIRELFALVYVSDAVLTVDTSVLHIAASFKKKTILLPGIINPEWRTYDSVTIVRPKVKCFPCNRMIVKGKPCSLVKSCPDFIDKQEIICAVNKIYSKLISSKTLDSIT